MYIGIGGVITFKNAKKLPDVVKMLPEDKILLETDAPYLTPTPFRGKRNEPSYVIHTARRIADLTGHSIDEVYTTTYNNACRLFNL